MSDAAKHGEEMLEALDRLMAAKTTTAKRDAYGAVVANFRAFVEAKGVDVQAALARARAEALEEAAQACETEAGNWMDGAPCLNAAGRIRRLITTPAPASIPVERVREAAANEMYDASKGLDERHEFFNRGVRALASSLGVPLDAATEACTCTQANGMHGPLCAVWPDGPPCPECETAGGHKLQCGRRP